MSTLELTRYCLGVIPELILGLTICAVILIDMFAPLRRSRMVCGSVALLGLVWALLMLLPQAGEAVAARILPEYRAAAGAGVFPRCWCAMAWPPSSN